MLNWRYYLLNWRYYLVNPRYNLVNWRYYLVNPRYNLVNLRSYLVNSRYTSRYYLVKIEMLHGKLVVLVLLGTIKVPRGKLEDIEVGLSRYPSINSRILR